MFSCASVAFKRWCGDDKNVLLFPWRRHSSSAEIIRSYTDLPSTLCNRAASLLSVVRYSPVLYSVTIVVLHHQLWVYCLWRFSRALKLLASVFSVRRRYSSSAGDTSNSSWVASVLSASSLSEIGFAGCIRLLCSWLPVPRLSHGAHRTILGDCIEVSYYLKWLGLAIVCLFFVENLALWLSSL